MLNKELHGINLNLANAGMTTSGAAATVTLAAATVAVIEGAFTTALTAGAKTMSFVDKSGVATAAVPVAANNAFAMVHCIDAAGTFRTIQGPSVAMDSGSGALLGPIQFPTIPDTLVPLGYTTVRVGSTASTFTPGTSNWNATGITAATVNVASLPSRPVFP